MILSDFYSQKQQYTQRATGIDTVSVFIGKYKVLVSTALQRLRFIVLKI